MFVNERCVGGHMKFAARNLNRYIFLCLHKKGGVPVEGVVSM